MSDRSPERTQRPPRMISRSADRSESGAVANGERSDTDKRKRQLDHATEILAECQRDGFYGDIKIEVRDGMIKMVYRTEAIKPENQ